MPFSPNCACDTCVCVVAVAKRQKAPAPHLERETTHTGTLASSASGDEASCVSISGDDGERGVVDHLVEIAFHPIRLRVLAGPSFVRRRHWLDDTTYHPVNFYTPTHHTHLSADALTWTPSHTAFVRRRYVRAGTRPQTHTLWQRPRVHSIVEMPLCVLLLFVFCTTLYIAMQTSHSSTCTHT